jgi:hypothetical protein
VIIASEFGSTGSFVMSFVHGLFGPKGTKPFRSAIWPVDIWEQPDEVCDGEDGELGEDGDDGELGEDGEDGEEGEEGEEGEVGCVEGGALTSKLAAEEVLPPGSGFWTAMANEPADEELPEAVRCVEETNVVLR